MFIVTFNKFHLYCDHTTYFRRKAQTILTYWQVKLWAIDRWRGKPSCLRRVSGHQYHCDQWFVHLCPLQYSLFVWWCLTPLSTAFQLYRGGQFYCWRETRGSRENNRPVVSHSQTLSYNVVHLALIEIRTHNISGDRHWLH